MAQVAQDLAPVLSLRNVSKHFAGVLAVNGVDMDVLPGERRVIIGPNGAGKTTLFNLITGALRTDGGRITLFGHDITKRPVQSRVHLGLTRTYQVSNLFLGLTVRESLYLATKAGRDMTALRPWGMDRDAIARGEEVAQTVGLSSVIDSPVRALSHGEQRQLELGMAIASKPRIVLLDEPAAGLSPAERGLITTLISEMPLDVTIVLIEHNMDLVMALASKITVMFQGGVIAEGSPADVKQNPKVQGVYLGEWSAHD